MNKIKNIMLGIVSALALASAGFALYSCDSGLKTKSLPPMNDW